MNNSHNPHGVHKVGDFSSYGDPSLFTSANKNEQKDFGINSKQYHFHVIIQELEDGIIELWKEQNKNFNKDRELQASSLSDAKFRKIYTTMITPVFKNVLFVICLYLFIPLLFSVNIPKINNVYIDYIAVFTGIVLLSNYLFDGYIVYRIRRYVIEQVTKNYYMIIKKTWKSFEFLLIVLSLFFFAISLYYNFYTVLEINVENKYLVKLISYFDLSKLLEINLYLVPINLALYFLFVRIIDNKSAKIQKIAIIESRKNSEHNADVAESLLDGTYLDIDMKNI